MVGGKEETNTIEAEPESEQAVKDSEEPYSPQ